MSARNKKQRGQKFGTCLFSIYKVINVNSANFVADTDVSVRMMLR